MSFNTLHGTGSWCSRIRAGAEVELGWVLAIILWDPEQVRADRHPPLQGK